MNHDEDHIIEVQGHRGCRGLLPENTIPAFSKAIDLGVHTLEMDLAISKDKKVVVSHEPFMSRRTCLDPFGHHIPMDMDMKHNLYAMDYAAIRTFDCGSKINPDYPDQIKMKAFKPLLDDVIESSESQSSTIKYNLELKAKPSYDHVFTPTPEDFVKLVLKVITTYGVFERTNLQSFDLRILEDVKKQAPKMKVAILINEDENIEEKLQQLSFKPDCIGPYFKLLDRDNVNRYQKRDFKITPWTVNEDQDLKHMIALGVDAIITDYPNKLINLL